MKKIIFALSLALAFVLGFALNGVLQNCKTSCDRGGHSSCERSCVKSGEDCQGSSCERHGTDCAKHGDSGCGPKDSAMAGKAGSQEIPVVGGEKACCKKSEHGHP